jgi:hypothetical protein
MSFASDLRRFQMKADRESDRQIRAKILSLTAGIIQRTPVDTGRARGNWQATIGAPAQGAVERMSKTGSAAISAAMPAIRQAKGNVFYLTNNLPYIAHLEFGLYTQGPFATERTTRDGYSVQAPYGMVRLTIRELWR